MQTYVISYKKTYKSQVQYIRDQSSIRWLSAQFSCSVVSNSLRPHGLQHTTLPCPPPSPGVYSHSRASSWWRHPTISSSVVPFSSCRSSFPASQSFPMSQLFTSGGQKVLELQFQHQSFQWLFRVDSPLRWTGRVSLQSKGLSGVFSNTTKAHMLGAQ